MSIHHPSQVEPQQVTLADDLPSSAAQNEAEQPSRQEQFNYAMFEHRNSQAVIDSGLLELLYEMDHLVHAHKDNDRLGLNRDTAYELLNQWKSAHYLNDASPEVIAEQVKAVKLVLYFLKKIAENNHLLIPPNRELVKKSGVFKLRSALMSGINALRTDSMAPTYPKGTLVCFYELSVKKWQNASGIVHVITYMPDEDGFDAVGRVLETTPYAITIRFDNPEWKDRRYEWREIVRIVSIGYVATKINDQGHE